MTPKTRVAIVFPAEASKLSGTRVEETRLSEVAKAFREAGADVVSAPFADEIAAKTETQLARADIALVWFNPNEAGRDRSVLNRMLRSVAGKNVIVSAHPDVIDKMGTKEVLFRTKGMGWGCDTRLYTSLDAMSAELPESLAHGPRVLKQMRGQSGDGVWSVALEHVQRKCDAVSRENMFKNNRLEPVHDSTKREQALATEVHAPSQKPTMQTALRIRHAKRGCIEEAMTLGDFTQLCRPYFEAAGAMIDQPYQTRISEGMIRCYVVRDRVTGFGEQLVNALYPAPAGSLASEAPQPGPRLYFPPDRADFQILKSKLEDEWIGEMCRLLGLSSADLPVLWDADFLLGPKASDGADTYVLCETNVSSVYPFPPTSLAPLVEETLARSTRAR